jgi:IS30 family transposase
MSNYNQGERHYKAKLTADDVRLIRELVSEREVTIRDIAQKFGVSHHAIHQAATYKTWKHVR